MADNAAATLTSASTSSTGPCARLWPGLVLSTIIALAAWQLGGWLPLVGGPVFGILLGVIVRNTVQVPATCQPGIQFAGKQVLQWSIIALGFGLSLDQVVQTGMSSLSVTLVTILAAFVSAWFLGRVLDIPSRLKTLIGVGTAICGGSAIAASTPIIKADEHETAFAISTIFLFNLIAVLLFPLLGHLLGMSDHAFGLWAGTAINDTSSVVAAGYSYSNAAGDFATIVKLTRATLIIPVCLALVAIEAWRHKKDATGHFKLRRIFPWFILWFVVAAAINTLGWIPSDMQHGIHWLAELMIIVALSGIGLSADIRSMIHTGFRPIALGLGVWAAVTVSSLAMQGLLGQL